MIKASALYYKTKLCSLNFSLYNLASHQCTCYWFNECKGDLTANTFASYVYDYLEDKCLDPKLPIILYTDGCTAQNRNQIFANALLHFSVKHQVQVYQKFLIKGHTQMEGDSVHAKIENKHIYLPYELSNIQNKPGIIHFHMMLSTWNMTSLQTSPNSNTIHQFFQDVRLEIL